MFLCLCVVAGHASCGFTTSLVIALSLSLCVCVGGDVVQVFQVHHRIPFLEFSEHQDSIVGLHIMPVDDEVRLASVGFDNQIITWLVQPDRISSIAVRPPPFF